MRKKESSLGKKFGPPPEKGPNPQGLKQGGCPHRDITSKNMYPGNNSIQVKGFKFIGVK